MVTRLVCFLFVLPLTLGAHEQFMVSTHSGDNIAIYDTSGAFIGNALNTSTLPSGGALKEMRDVMIGPDSLLYVVNSSIDSSPSGAGSLASSVLRFQRNGSQWDYYDQFAQVISASTLSHPFSLTFSDGVTPNIYVSTQDGDKPIGYSTGGLASPQALDTLTTFAASDTPRQLAFGPDGSLYIANEYTGTVQKFDSNTSSFEDFTAGYSLMSPSHFVFYGGDLYVNSPDENRIVRFDGTTGAYVDVWIDHGNLDKPSGFAFDEAGVFYVANRTSDGGVLKYHVDGSGHASFDTEIVSGIADPEFIYFLPADSLVIPEPNVLGLVATGLFVVWLVRRRRVCAGGPRLSGRCWGLRSSG